MTKIYNVKMRASKNKNGSSLHISGAERIIREDEIELTSNILIRRALKHENDSADFINIKVQEINLDDIVYLKALPVKTVEVANAVDGYFEIEKLLKENNIPNSDKIIDFMKDTSAMRGAMLLDINTLQRLEPNKDRGVRATCMDSDKILLSTNKNHFREAVILATKVINAPNIVGEICVSDDINYQTGYFASKNCGYVRITKLKNIGDTFGGRIFLYDGKTDEDLKRTLEYIENKPVIVTDIPILNPKIDKYLKISKKLDKIKQNNLYRIQSVISDVTNSNVKINDKKYKMFASNNYLGLANNKDIIEYSIETSRKYGVGTGGSRLVSGNFDLHEKLEQKIAKFKNTESAILFNSGYSANVSTLSALFGEGDVIFSDELNHASIIDGCRLSKARTIVYKHNDMQDLENKINDICFDNGVIVSDAVFSMDGDIAKLPEILKLSKKYNLFSYIDEAHSTGVIGKTGRGIVEYFGLNENPDILMGTLSKAIGSEGGYIACSKLLTDYFRNTVRSYIFSTSLPPSVVGASIKSFEILENDTAFVKNLHENIEFFNKCLQKNNINIKSQTPIFSIIIGDEKKTLKIAQKLEENNYFIKAIRYPTVPKGSARLRITLSAMHDEKDLSDLADTLSELLNE